MSNKFESAFKTRDWPVVEVDGLKLLRSPLLSAQSGLVHAFTTRHGGKCPKPFDNFNLGRSVGDDEVKVGALRNRERLLTSLGLDHDKLKVPGQVHSGTVVKLEGESHDSLSGVDGLATKLSDLPMLLHFADCVPVMVYERQQRILAIVHAGWRGTAQSIAVNAVKAITELGGAAENIVAAVGPAIGPCCYPTADEVAEQLLSTVETNLSKEMVSELVPRSDKPRPDLKAINAMQLLQAGVHEVDVSSYCTACHARIFYSHRQSGGTTGRQGALACLVGSK